MKRYLPESLFLGAGNRLFRVAEIQAGVGSGFDKYQGVLVPGDDVNLTVRTTGIAFDDLADPFPEGIPGHPLSQDANIPMA